MQNPYLHTLTHYKTHTYTHQHITKTTHTPTYYKTHTYTHSHITKPHTYTHPHNTKSVHTRTHTLQNTHIHTSTLYKNHTYTHTLQTPHIHTPTHYKTHTCTHPHIATQVKQPQYKIHTKLNLCSWVDKDGLKHTSSCHRIQIMIRVDPVVTFLWITWNKSRQLVLSRECRFWVTGLHTSLATHLPTPLVLA